MLLQRHYLDKSIMTFLKTSLVAIGLVLAPIKMALIVAFASCVVDLILGIMAARKRGEVIRSFGLRRTAGKILVFEAAIILAYFIELYLLGPELMVLKLVTAYIGLTELKSIMENLNELSDGSLLKAIVDKLSALDVKPPENK